MQATVTPAGIALEIHICAQRRSYVARFTTEDQAITFLERKSTGHAFREIEAEPLPETARKLLDWLYPLCEHGMSAAFCSGPHHYAEPGEPGWN